MRNRFVLLICLTGAFNYLNAQTYYPYYDLNNAPIITWTNTNLISGNNDWSNVPYIKGFRGDALAGPDTDPRTILSDGTGTPSFIVANQSTPASYSGDGFVEFESLAIPSIAVKPSSTASAPFLMVYVNTLNLVPDFFPSVSFNLRDIDGGATNAIQQVSIQYRIGETGPFIPAQESFISIPSYFDLFDGYHPDVTKGPMLEGHRSIGGFFLPEACRDQPKVQIRILFNHSSNENEWVAIEEIRIGGIILLPIRYSSFTAHSQKNEVILRWRANTSSAYDLFEIERSEDGVLYNKIGEKAPGSTGESDYIFTDVSPVKGTSYYRLKLRGYGERTSYTHIEKISRDVKENFEIYPTNTTSEINLAIASDKSSHSQLQIVNTGGAVVKKQTLQLIKGDNKITVSVSELPPGTYFVRLHIEGKIFTERFIKQ